MSAQPPTKKSLHHHSFTAIPFLFVNSQPFQICRGSILAIVSYKYNLPFINSTNH